MARFFTFTLLVLLTLPINAQARDKLTIGMTQYPSTMHPTIDSMLAKTYILAMTQRPFTLYDADWNLTCMLCTELPSIEKGTAKIEKHIDGSEGMALTYTIQPNAKWGDGVPVTTKDVLFSWQVGKHPMSGVSNFELYTKDILNITVADDKTFTLHMDKVTCDFESIDDFRVLPEHLERIIFEQDPATYKERTLYDSDPTNAGLYFGPYLISNIESGIRFDLEPNPYWWGKKPEFNQISIKIIENSAALSANLLSGDIDYIAGELGMKIDQALSFEKRLKRTRMKEYNISYKPGLIYEHIDLNQDNPVLQNLKTRQALLYAINRKAISSQLFSNKQPIAQSNINPLDNIFSSDTTQYPYNPEKARQLLDDAGWSLKDDGYRYNDKGEKLSLQQMTTAGDKTREMVQQAIQSNWKDVGIDSTIDNEPARVFFGQTTRERKFKDTAMYAWLSAPRNIPRTTLHSTMIPNTKNNYAGQNYPGFKNEELDKVLDDLETVCEPKANQQLWTRQQQIYTEQLPALPLYYRAEPYIIPIWLKGIVPTGHQYPTTFWIENWRSTE